MLENIRKNAHEIKNAFFQLKTSKNSYLKNISENTKQLVPVAPVGSG